MSTSTPAPRNKPTAEPLNFPHFSQDYLDKYAASNLRKSTSCKGSALLLGILRSFGGAGLLGQAYALSAGTASDPVTQSRLCALFSLLVTSPAPRGPVNAASALTRGAAEPKLTAMATEGVAAPPQSLIELLEHKAIPAATRKSALKSLRKALVVALSQQAAAPQYSDVHNPELSADPSTAVAGLVEDSMFQLMKMSAGDFHMLVYGSLIGLGARAPKSVELVTTTLRATHSAVVSDLVRALVKLLAPLLTTDPGREFDLALAREALTPAKVDELTPEQLQSALDKLALALEQQYAEAADKG